jgi:GT2 family glycosyltransferase/peptidoglycan/xylan/chitin deacetylase (PgdA/CDA1 family)/glycosyltransferase involved in cell wall biosynthesis
VLPPGASAHVRDLTNARISYSATDTSLTEAIRVTTPTGTLSAHPNPAHAPGNSWLASTTISWTFGGARAIEIRVGSPDGTLFSRAVAPGSLATGAWVSDGLKFYLQDVSDGAPLTGDHTLATATVAVVPNPSTAPADAVILAYHRVADERPDPWSLCVTPARFVEQMAVLREQGEVISLTTFMRRLHEGAIQRRSIVVTFDDGYADNLHVARPVLEHFRIPATVFVASGYIGDTHGFWWDELLRILPPSPRDDDELYRTVHGLLQPLSHRDRRLLLDQLQRRLGASAGATGRPMNAAELGALASCDLIEVGAHSVTHPILPALSEPEQRREIVDSRRTLETIVDRPVAHFAYPFGRFDAQTVRLVEEAAFTSGCTTAGHGVHVDSTPHQLPRVVVGDWNADEFRAHLTRWFQPTNRRARPVVPRGRSTAGSDSAERIAALEREVARLRADLEHAEHVRRETAIGVRAFRQQFEAVLAAHRRDRAWRLMLQLRKAHRLVSGRSVAAFARWLPQIATEPAAALVSYERGFPALDTYVPPELAVPFDGEAPQAGARLPRAVGRQTTYDVIMMPVFEYDFRVQRPQHLALQFAASGHRVFWISPSRRPVDEQRPFEAVQLRENLWEVHLAGARPDIYSGELDEDTTREIVGSLGCVYREWAIAENAVIVQLPFWRSVGVALRDEFGARLVFDCMDDWEAMPGLSEFNRREEPRLVEACDLLVLSARRLEAKYAERARRSVVAPNAADYAFFAAQSPVHADLGRLPRPVVGYVGAIAGWFDYDLYYRVAVSRPQYTFVFVGALGLERHVLGTEIARFRSLPNVHLLGHRPYADLPAYVAGFDVCTIPFILDEVTRATDPVKVYEYLSAGKPVVATPMPELDDRSALIYTGATPDEFASAIDRALAADDTDLRHRRREYASAQTWTRRVQTIDAAVRHAYPLVSVLIVTHNSHEFVEPCLQSVFRNRSYPRMEVLVVDNGSTDDTPALLAQQTGTLDLRTILLPENRGFAAANNLAAREALGEYLILLNVDTVVTPGWIERLVRHTRRDPSIGLVVPVTNWAGNEAKIDVVYTNLREMEEFALARARDCMGDALDLPVAPLFCTLIPRHVWRTVGELDEGFEIGMFEDDDYSVRVRREGLRVVTAEDCFIHHFGRGSFAKLPPERYQQVFERNLQRFRGKWGNWTPHRNRPGVRPEHVPYGVEDFVIAGDDPLDTASPASR